MKPNYRHSIQALSLLALIGCTFPLAEASMMTHQHVMVGCSIKEQFVPYAGQVLNKVEPLPSWVREYLRQNIEGREIRVRWVSYDRIPSQLPVYSSKRRLHDAELRGPCDRSRLVDK